ncbi:MAG: hypothetical protein HY261_01625 [Chloroflexi bacterium]|nr:hypothetical protein [Chloroflexota bacterium]
MPIYEFRCNKCRKLTSVLSQRYEVPKAVTCESCGSSETRLRIGAVATKVANQAKYNEDFTGKTLPFLKSKFPKEFERAGPGVSEESVAHKLNEQIGGQVDRVIDKTLKNIHDSK